MTPQERITLIRALNGLHEADFNTLVTAVGAGPRIPRELAFVNRVERFVEWAAVQPGGHTDVISAAAQLGIALGIQDVAPPPINPAKPSPFPTAPLRAPVTASPVSLFYSYCHKDEELRDKLDTHLKLMQREGLIAPWHDRRITAGTEWDGEINTHLETAQVILLLISADFVASDYIWDVEVKRAMERHEARSARVIPIILRPCEWHSAPFGKLQGLPKDGKPITTWPNQDEALLDVAKGIRRAVKELGNP